MCSLLTSSFPSFPVERTVIWPGNVDRAIHRLGEGRTFLDMVVGEELEVTALREDRSFIIDRAVLETEE
jgi:hypothetical protein